MHQHFLSEEEIHSQRKKFLGIQRNFFAEEEIACQRKKFWRKIFLIIGRNFLSEEEILCQSKRFLFGGRNFVVRGRLRGRHFLSEEEVSFQSRRNLLAEEEISCCRIHFLVKGLMFSLIDQKTQMRQKCVSLD